MIRAFKMRLEYGMGPEFEKRHAEVWPEVVMNGDSGKGMRSPAGKRGM